MSLLVLNSLGQSSLCGSVGITVAALVAVTAGCVPTGHACVPVPVPGAPGAARYS